MNIPNMLSLFRLALVPVFVAVFFADVPHAGYIAAGVFLLAFLTDVADGYIARRFDMITRLGRILDPLADKMMKTAAVVCLTIDGRLPWTVIAILAAKELLMMIGGAVLMRRTQDVPPSNWWGKCAEGCLCLLTFLLIMVEIPADTALFLWGGVLTLELVALFVYTRQALEILHGAKKGNA